MLINMCICTSATAHTLLGYYQLYKIKKEIINANKAIASTNAKAKIAYENNSPLILGFLDVPKINEANTNPIPIPGPNNAIAANPAPKYLPNNI